MSDWNTVNVQPPGGSQWRRSVEGGDSYIIRDHSRRVKRWESGEMALRWSAAGMLAAQARFRRVEGYRELPILAAALKRELHIASTAIATN